MRGRPMLRRLPGATRVRTRYRALVEASEERREARARASAYRLPVNDSQVFYESFSGNGMLCNPEAIFRRLLDAPDMQHLHHVWALDDPVKQAKVVERFAGHPRVSFVEMRSPDYLTKLATSKYLINNATFPQEFAKREGQIYLNTWHGVPLKRMGYDLDDGGTVMRNVLRNMVSADYLLSASEYMTDRLYRQAFRLQGVFRGKVIEEGQPRTDLQLVAERDPKRVITELESSGLAIGDRKIILYAPTWKGESFWAPEANSQQLVSVVQRLQESVDAEKYVVLLKAHQVIYDAVVASGEGRRVLVPNDLPTNALLGVTDVLVTDYSSIFFDFLPTGRPILHHVPDLDQYGSGRGLYIDDSELFGPISHNIDELLEQVRTVVAAPWEPDDRRAQAIATYAPHEDGSVADRVIDIVFRGADQAGLAGHRVVSDFSSGKPSMLIYVGGLTSNGLTSSALNLLRHLDYDRFDVSVLYHSSKNRDRVKNQRLIDPRCRHFIRMGTPVASPRAVRAEQKRMEKGLPERLPPSHREFWRDEWRRVFGHARFDYGLDLSGYGTSVPYLFINGDIDQRVMWLHNDLKADAERETAGFKHLKERLNAVFSTFRYFDRLVSVSEELNRVNSERLAQFAPPDKFTYARNTIDHERVLEMAGRDRSQEAVAVSPDGAGTAGLGTFDVGNVSSAVATLLEFFDAKTLLAEVRSQTRVPGVGSGNVRTFVNVARLSPEKNQARLIRAFAKVWQHTPESRLVIVGSGKLERELRELTRSLGVQEFVSFAGHVDNPYVIMAKADCFVLSSDYEGQPMVVLEARTLGLPVISTRFGSVEGSVPPGAGLVVEQSDDALAEGMSKFLAGEVACDPFDCEAYNAEAMEQFYAAIGAAAHAPRS